MPLDPQARAHLEQMAAKQAPPAQTLTPDEARQDFEARSADFGQSEPVANVEDRMIPGPAGEIHGFLIIGASWDRSRQAVTEAAAALRRSFSADGRPAA